MCGFTAQLVEHRTGVAEVMGSNPVEALIFFRLLPSNCLDWKIYCDDHSSLSFIILLNLLTKDSSWENEGMLGTQICYLQSCASRVNLHWEALLIKYVKTKRGYVR